MDLPQRKPTRLPGYDYSSEHYYFVTVCTHNRRPLFVHPAGNGLTRSEMILTEYGKITEYELLNIPHHFDGVRIDQYVIMPDHIHAIIIIGCDGQTERAIPPERSRPFPTLSAVVGLYKAGVTRRIHEIEPAIKVWQKSFYDRIIRDEAGYREVWQYIDENPKDWETDTDA